MLSRMKIWKKNDGADIEQSKQIDFTERKKEKSLVYFSEDGFDCCCCCRRIFARSPGL